MPEGHAKSIKILVRQLAEYLDVNVILGKTLRILRHAECFEPVRKVLHCAAPSATVVSAFTPGYPTSPQT
jgi:hypothetical protein